MFITTGGLNKDQSKKIERSKVFILLQMTVRSIKEDLALQKGASILGRLATPIAPGALRRSDGRSSFGGSHQG
jgi:hypothetical protein